MPGLIIAATDLELAWLAAQLHGRPDRPLLDFPVLTAGAELRLITSGPGMANAAAAAAAAVERYRPACIYNVGICGVYADDAALLGKAVTGSRALFADTGAAGDAGFKTLQDINLPLACSGGKIIYNAVALACDCDRHDIPHADFLTVASVSDSPAAASLLAARFAPPAGALLCEDMESAAVALVALRAEIPCTVVRGISNICGRPDRSRWKIGEAALAAQEFLFEMLKRHEQAS